MMGTGTLIPCGRGLTVGRSLAWTGDQDWLAACKSLLQQGRQALLVAACVAAILWRRRPTPLKANKLQTASMMGAGTVTANS